MIVTLAGAVSTFNGDGLSAEAIVLLTFVEGMVVGVTSWWSGMFSANSLSSILMSVSFSGAWIVWAYLYGFSPSILTTQVPLFFSCPAYEASGVTPRVQHRVLLLVGSAHMIQGPDQ